MDAKTLEITDKATFIPALAVRVSGADGYLMRRAGFGSPVVYLIHLSSERCFYDPYNWDNRTMLVAHQYIKEEWDSIKERDVIDVEFILGESRQKKQSEEVEVYG